MKCVSLLLLVVGLVSCSSTKQAKIAADAATEQAKISAEVQLNQ